MNIHRKKAFISHATSDDKFVVELKGLILGLGYESVFNDADYDSIAPDKIRVLAKDRRWNPHCRRTCDRYLSEIHKFEMGRKRGAVRALLAHRQLGDHVRGLVHPTAVLARFRPDLTGSFPEPERAIGDARGGTSSLAVLIVPESEGDNGTGAARASAQAGNVR